MEEDLILINYIANHGEGVWNSLAKAAGMYIYIYSIYLSSLFVFPSHVCSDDQYSLLISFLFFYFLFCFPLLKTLMIMFTYVCLFCHQVLSVLEKVAGSGG